MANGAAALAWGTFVYILLGTAATAAGMMYFDRSTSGTKEDRSENRKYVSYSLASSYYTQTTSTYIHTYINRLVAIHVPLATFCLWIMWASCWLHQWHPLIMPTVSTENG